MNTNPRKLAVDIIFKVLKGESSLSDEITSLRTNYDCLKIIDVRFVSELSNGVIRNLEYIDYVISCVSDVKINKISPYVLCVLRSGVYQLIYMDKVPPSAAVNESVKIIRKSSNSRLTGFVNAVLRKISSVKDNIELPDEHIKNISIKYSCPEWIVNKIYGRIGNETDELFKSLNTKTATVLRTNTLKTNPETLIESLNSYGWSCRKYNSDIFPDIDYLIVADKIENIDTCPEYKAGHFYIQDPAAAYVAEVLKPLEGSLILDMCAAPGGKTTHFAEKIKDKGRVVAFDVSENKINRIVENANRLGLNSVEAYVNDATVIKTDLLDSADFILVDSPCSGIGIIRKKPDIKYLRKPTDSSELAKISLNILNTSSKYLKKGGYMVFSTCTLFEEENEGVLFEFLKNNPEFSLKKIDCAIDNNGYITLYPHKNNCDGFFISLLTRN